MQEPPQNAQRAAIAPEDDFISLADLIRMVWRHRRGILAVTLLAALATAVYLFLKPRPYEASAMMEVVPEYSREGRVDKDIFETSVLTHHETARSSVVGMRVHKFCEGAGINLDFADLMSLMKVIRPPKTSIIQGSIILPKAEDALAIARVWRDETIREVQRKAMEKALIYVRGRLKELQEDWLKYTAAVQAARRNAEQLEDQKYITVSRSVDDTVLWQDLVKPADSNALGRMRDLQLKSQEMNEEYLDARNRLAEAEEKAAGAVNSREFYVRVVAEISRRMQSFNGGGAKPSADLDAADELAAQALDYVNTQLSSKEVLPLGEPVVYRGSRGAMKKTALAGLAAFFIASFAAFVYEWSRRLGLE